MDLKKLPNCRGYQYVCNIVDCFSRFAMGGAIKNKSAKDEVEVFLECVYRYGPPRILQTDNGKEFNNGQLSSLMDELKSLKINGRPYHPQSQGRVERFNQTLANFLRRDLQNEPDWPSRLSYFYYTYNTRSSRSLNNRTPYDVYHRRPNFSLYCAPSRNNLSSEEREFLDQEHLPLEEGMDVVDGDGDDSCSTAASDDAVHVAGIDDDANEGADHESFASLPEPPTTMPRDSPEEYPLEVQWSTGDPDFLIDQPVFYRKAANLGGAAGVASLQPQWLCGKVVSHHTEPGNFLLYGVEDENGVSQGKFDSASLSARAVLADTEQHLERAPEGWCQLPEPHRGAGRRRRR